MKKYSKLNEIRFNQVKPSGWINEFLQCEADGMPGHLHEIGYPFDRFCWQYKSLTDGGYAQWWPYEQTAYWIDSVVRTAVLTDNDKLLDVVMDQIEKSLADDSEPFIGPREMKEEKSLYRWPHAVYFRALYALWSKSGDERYLEKMRKHYLSDTPENYKNSRDYVNIETILKLAEHFNDEELYKLALDSFELFNKEKSLTSMDTLLSDVPPSGHAVSFNEDAKIPAIMYMYTGDKKYLDASVNAYKKMRIFHELPDGLHSCSEGPCGKDEWRTHESCDISDYTWSVGYLLEATGNGEYADIIERVCFNALPGATGHYFKTIQYLSCVNQVICARNSTHIPAWYNTPRMAYQPHHYPECCVSNIGRAMPNYVLRMYQEFDGGVAASLYGDSTYTGQNMTLTQSGGYPFSSKTKFEVKITDGEEKFLKLRIPSWSKGFTLKINDSEVNTDVINGYTEISVKDNDKVELLFNMALTMIDAPNGGFYYNYGPFLMTLKIDSEEVIDDKEKRSTKDFPAYNIYPKSKWNYAVKRLENDDKPVIKIKEPTKNPFWDNDYPIEITVKARELKNWGLEEIENTCALDRESGEGIDQKQLDCGATMVTENLTVTPKLPDKSFVTENLGQETDITLVPYGCTTVRLTVLPKYTQDFVHTFDFLGD